MTTRSNRMKKIIENENNVNNEDEFFNAWELIDGQVIVNQAKKQAIIDAKQTEIDANQSVVNKLKALGLTDEEIKAMQEEIDEEKEAGLGLPVGVMNDVAQQQMMADVPQQPTNPIDLQHAQDMQDNAQASVQKEETTITKLKRIL